MENQVAMEAAEILKKLSPQNQAYFMTMLRVADATERNVKCRRQARRRSDVDQEPEPCAADGRKLLCA